MFSTIKAFFDDKLAAEENDEASRVAQTDLASAALLIEVINSDHELDDREHDEFLNVLQKSLNISDEDIEDLVKLAKEEAAQATSLYEFTRLINDNFEYEKKCELIENMWRIAFSDSKLDKYEEHLIRRVSELIYVKHSDFIRTKLKARDS